MRPSGKMEYSNINYGFMSCEHRKSYRCNRRAGSRRELPKEAGIAAGMHGPDTSYDEEEIAGLRERRAPAVDGARVISRRENAAGK
ncbi:hypothetical protein VT03_24685 [Planctomyces sp. SH-PL14]|nr:hypothetical protein VT03_24685 [Planctomyces sp. SH-PL14]